MKKLAAISLLACASVGLPHADATDARRAGVDLATLEHGRQTYAARCSGCHALHRPNELTPEQWSKRIHEMSKDARLQPGEEQLIANYLVTLSLRSQGAGGQ